MIQVRVSRGKKGSFIHQDALSYLTNDAPGLFFFVSSCLLYSLSSRHLREHCLLLLLLCYLFFHLSLAPASSSSLTENIKKHARIITSSASLLFFVPLLEICNASSLECLNMSQVIASTSFFSWVMIRGIIQYHVKRHHVDDDHHHHLKEETKQPQDKTGEAHCRSKKRRERSSMKYQS